MGVRRLFFFAAACASMYAGAPQLAPQGVVSAASFRPTLVRGGLATIFGTSLASNTVFAQTVPLPTNLGGVTVTIGGIAAPISYVSPTQVNFQVPVELGAGTMFNATVGNGSGNAVAQVTLADSDVEIFTYARTSTATDPVIVHGATNLLVTPTNPAVPNEVLIAYATGVGKVNHPVVSGMAAPPAPLASAMVVPAATAGGQPAQVQFAGLAPGMIGVTQINFKLPASLPVGALPLVFYSGAAGSAPVNLIVAGTSGPHLVLSTQSVDFGAILVGQTATQTFTISNTGTDLLSVSSISTFNYGLTVTSPIGGVMQIPAGTSQAVTVSYTPPLAGVLNGPIMIVSNDGFSPATVQALALASVPAPLMAPLPASLSAGVVQLGQTAILSLPITNLGTGPLTISAATVLPPFTVTGPAFPAVVPPGGSTQLSISFAPTANPQVNVPLTILTNDALHASSSVTLTGSGIGLIACTFSLGPDIYAKWQSLGADQGILGCPTANEVEAKSVIGTTGRTATFVHGQLFWHRTGIEAGRTFAVTNCVLSYSTALGFPRSDPFNLNPGTETDFEAGYMIDVPTVPAQPGVPAVPEACMAFGQDQDFSGVWNTDLGPMQITQDHMAITGRIQVQNYATGTLTGTIGGGVAYGSVSFPNALQSFALQLSENGKNVNGTYSGALASGPQLWLSPRVMDFGTVPVGQTSVQLLAVTAGGPESVVMTLGACPSPGFVCNAGQVSASAGQTITIPVQFAPTASGPFSGTLTVRSNDAGRPVTTVLLKGVAQ